MTETPLTPRRVFLWMKLTALAGIALLFVLLYTIGENQNEEPFTALKQPDFEKISGEADSQAGSNASTAYRKKLPVFKWNNSRGQTLGHDEFIGRWTLINFWAHWCWPCHVELPKLNRAVETSFEELNLTTLLVNVDKENSDHQKSAEEFLKKENIELKSLFDSLGTLTKIFGVAQFPYHVLINPMGEIVFAEAGAVDWESPKVILGLTKLLKNDSATQEPAVPSKNE